MPKGSKSLDQRERTTRNEAARSITTDRRGTVVADDSILGQPRAVCAREAIVRPHLNRLPYGYGLGGSNDA
jgi:hypothetical protein